MARGEVLKATTFRSRSRIRRAWDQRMIDEAEALLFRASAMGIVGRFQLEAAVQSAHVVRRVSGKTDWAAIEKLYDALSELTGSPVVAINRAVAIAETRGPAAGLAELDAIAGDERLAEYQPYWAARASLLSLAGNKEAADEAYQLAIGLGIRSGRPPLPAATPSRTPRIAALPHLPRGTFAPHRHFVRASNGLEINRGTQKLAQDAESAEGLCRRTLLRPSTARRSSAQRLDPHRARRQRSLPRGPADDRGEGERSDDGEPGGRICLAARRRGRNRTGGSHISESGSG